MLFQSTDCSKTLNNTSEMLLFIRFTHTFIHWWRRLPCKVPAAHQEQFGFQFLAQGHFNMQLSSARIQTSNPPITRRPTLPPEQQPHKWQNSFAILRPSPLVRHKMLHWAWEWNWRKGNVVKSDVFLKIVCSLQCVYPWTAAIPESACQIQLCVALLCCCILNISMSHLHGILMKNG